MKCLRRSSQSPVTDGPAVRALNDHDAADRRGGPQPPTDWAAASRPAGSIRSRPARHRTPLLVICPWCASFNASGWGWAMTGRLRGRGGGSEPKMSMRLLGLTSEELEGELGRTQMSNNDSGGDSESIPT